MYETQFYRDERTGKLQLASYLLAVSDCRYKGRLITIKPKVAHEGDLYADDEIDMVLMWRVGAWWSTGMKASDLILWKRT